jgi:hypothetical protein
MTRGRERIQTPESSRFAIAREKGRLAFWVHVPIGNRWVAAQRLTRLGDQVVVSELRIFPAEKPKRSAGEWSRDSVSVPSGGLTASLVRSASVGRHVAAPVVTDWVEAMLSRELIWPAKHRALARRVAQELGLGIAPQLLPPSKRGRPGRKPGRDQAFFEELARDYRRWSGDEPAKRIAAKWKVSRATARTWIHTARHKLGLLPKTEPGRGSVFVRNGRTQ